MPAATSRPSSALKCLYLAIMSLDPTGKGRKRWTNRWKAALNAFDMTFDGRLSAGRNNNRGRSYTVNLTDPSRAAHQFLCMLAGGLSAQSALLCTPRGFAGAMLWPWAAGTWRRVG